MIDHRSYTGFNFTTARVVCVTVMINHKFTTKTEGLAGGSTKPTRLSAFAGHGIQ